MKKRQIAVILVAIAILFTISGCSSYTPLYKAARNNDVEEIKTLIEQGADIEEYCTFINHSVEQDTALCGAFKRESNYEAIKTLIDLGADVNAYCYTHMYTPRDIFANATPLMFASVKGDMEIAQMLIDAGADVNVRAKKAVWTKYETYDALFFALEGGHLEMARLLLKHGANPNTKYRESNPIAYVAAYMGRADFVVELLDNGMEVEVVSKYPSNLAEVSHIAADYYATSDPQKAIVLYNQAIQYYPEGAKTLEDNAGWKDFKSVLLAGLGSELNRLNARQQALQIKQAAAYSGQSTTNYIVYSYSEINYDASSTDYVRVKAAQCRKNYEICKEIINCHNADPSRSLVECIKQCNAQALNNK